MVCNAPAASLKRRILNSDQRILVVATLNLLVEREWHLLAIVAVAADATARDRLPLPPTASYQHVAGGMVPPMAEVRPVV
jgi:hypothetical protein